MPVCARPSEVVVCEHVNEGQPYDVLVMDEHDEFVGTAFCAECAQAGAQLLEVLPEYEKKGAMEEWYEKMCFNTRSQGICRECARELHIPDTTPNGEHLWERYTHVN